MKPNKVLIMGLGHLASFVVKELADVAGLWGTYRSECNGSECNGSECNGSECNGSECNGSKYNGQAFNCVNKVKYSSDDNIPQELIQDWSAVIWNLLPFKGYKEKLETFNSRISRTCPWIFLSSTSVYKQGDIHEDSKKESISKTGNLLIEIESILKGFQRNIAIVRPGGLLIPFETQRTFLKRKLR